MSTSSTRHPAPMIRVVALAVAAMLASCRVGKEQDAWVRWDEGGFQFSLPPQLVRVPVQGVDSHVGRFASTDESLVIDYDCGRYSNDLESERNSFKVFSSHREVIAGEEALVVVGVLKDDVHWIGRGRHVVAATWQAVSGKGSMKLTILVQMDDVTREAEMLTVLRSVQFR